MRFLLTIELCMLQLCDFYEVMKSEEHRSPLANGFNSCRNEYNNLKNDLRRRSINHQSNCNVKRGFEKFV